MMIRRDEWGWCSDVDDDEKESTVIIKKATIIVIRWLINIIIEESKKKSVIEEVMKTKDILVENVFFYIYNDICNDIYSYTYR